MIISMLITGTKKLLERIENSLSLRSMARMASTVLPDTGQGQSD